MIIDQLNNFFKEGKYESLIQFLNSTSYKEIDRNSINVIFLKFHSISM